MTKYIHRPTGLFVTSVHKKLLS